MIGRVHHRSPGAAVMALLLLTLLAILLQGATVPHTHVGEPGLYNQEHDLTLYAVTAGAAAAADAAPVLFAVIVVAAVLLSKVRRPESLRLAHASPRAPPAR